METFTLTLSVEHLGVINDGLVEMPFKTAAPVIDAVNAQIVAQRQARRDAELQKAASEHGGGPAEPPVNES